MIPGLPVDGVEQVERIVQSVDCLREPRPRPRRHAVEVQYGVADRDALRAIDWQLVAVAVARESDQRLVRERVVLGPDD